MQTLRCLCGALWSWTSFGPTPCSVCPWCGTSPSGSPNHEIKPAPHRYVTKYDQDTGKPYEICLDCMGKKERLEKDDKRGRFACAVCHKPMEGEADAPRFCCDACEAWWKKNYAQLEQEARPKHESAV